MEQVAGNGDVGVDGPGRLVWHDREGKPLGTAGAPSLIYELELGPDGERVAAGRLASASEAQRANWMEEWARSASSRRANNG